MESVSLQAAAYATAQLKFYWILARVKMMNLEINIELTKLCIVRVLQQLNTSFALAILEGHIFVLE